MKSTKANRAGETGELRKAQRLEPMRRSGKERHTLYRRLQEDEEEETIPRGRRESAFDYLDDDEQ